VSEAQKLQSLLKDLLKVTGENSAQKFTPLFKRGYALLDLSNEEAARVFDSSTRNVRRWKSGERVPPAATLVLSFLREEVEKEMRKPVKKEGVYNAASNQWVPVIVASQKKRPPPMAKPSAQYPHTCTTFRKQMEPGIHAVMSQALKMAGIQPEKKRSGKFTSEYKGVTRRIFRAAVISAMSFIKGKTSPSSGFLQKQGEEAINKAISKLYEGKNTSDAEDDKNLDNYQY